MPAAVSRDTVPAVRLADILVDQATRLARWRLPLRHLRVLQQIAACRTPALGGHRQWCDGCGYERYVYHSCRNRHCPQCQTHAKEAWREARQAELLPVPYFHQVFTLPHELNPWVLASERNQRALLKLLFDAAAGTLLKFGRQELGGEMGFTLVLHTWDQQLRPHFHVHGLIAAGALSPGQRQWIAGGNQFLFPVRALSKVYRGKFLSGFQELIDQQQLDVPASQGELPPAKLLRVLRRKAWIVYSKAPFRSPQQVLDYLSRYTHRVAISHHRLVKYEDGQVTFAYRDRADGDRRKHCRLDAPTFLRRFLNHVLPDRFTRLRHYGFLANRHKAGKLARIRQLLGVRPSPSGTNRDLAAWLRQVVGLDVARCPCCRDELLEERLPPAPETNRLLRIVLPLLSATRGPPLQP